MLKYSKTLIIVSEQKLKKKVSPFQTFLQLTCRPRDVKPFSTLMSYVTISCKRIGSVSMHLLYHLEQSNTDRLDNCSTGGVYSSEKMAGVFSYESSEIDWCEDNYKYSEHVVEYFNTMSSFFFFIISPIMLYLLHPYAKERNLAIHMVWTMMIFVGLFSAYFHMTLSFVGQMLDELSILWVLALGYAVWFPRRLFPSFIKERSTFSSLVLVVTVITTVSSFVKPTANAYVLNCFGLHMLYVLAVEMRCCTDRKALRLAKVSVALWVLAISCWISDRFGCSFWQRLNFCYLHGIWHILIVTAVAYGSTLIAYLDANYEIPYSLPGLQYWPCDKWAVGLPHIVLKGTTKTQKRC
ncbi:alkaline ceramidase 1 isoform X1 [Sander lucioperca]|uniref:alkaline ceramidase 1 isoform X1 n=1 Tax=Sander lucioperca TaxID=283035 RepID=UPI0016538A0D|nr:alkaline ceramidase 1 isoform X1 [Sander lucioperca]